MSSALSSPWSSGFHGPYDGMKSLLRFLFSLCVYQVRWVLGLCLGHSFGCEVVHCQYILRFWQFYTLKSCQVTSSCVSEWTKWNLEVPFLLRFCVVWLQNKMTLTTTSRINYIKAVSTNFKNTSFHECRLVQLLSELNGLQVLYNLDGKWAEHKVLYTAWFDIQLFRTCHLSNYIPMLMVLIIEAYIDFLHQTADILLGIKC